jgi:hypothetical protein
MWVDLLAVETAMRRFEEVHGYGWRAEARALIVRPQPARAHKTAGLAPARAPAG